MAKRAGSNSKPDLPHGVRLATAADRIDLVPLINSAFSIETFLEGTRTDEERLAAMMRKGEILLAENKYSQLLGCIYTEVRDSRVYLGRLLARVRGESRNARGYLDLHAVDPAYQGAGIGRLLIEASEDYLRRKGCEAVDIAVPSMRAELPHIYRRFGYFEIGTEEFHSSQPVKSGVECRAIVMSKQL
jgi:ribosomal protein S18 acetylase RimI-like enzyme